MPSKVERGSEFFCVFVVFNPICRKHIDTDAVAHLSMRCNFTVFGTRMSRLVHVSHGLAPKTAADFLQLDSEFRAGFRAISMHQSLQHAKQQGPDTLLRMLRGFYCLLEILPSPRSASETEEGESFDESCSVVISFETLVYNSKELALNVFSHSLHSTLREDVTDCLALMQEILS